jgi:site-specific recombinase XerD
VRRAEIAGMEMEDLDLDMREAKVHGKGRRDRTVTFGRKASVCMDRYLRERAKQKWADSPKLWLSEKNRGTLGDSGIYQMLKRLGAEVGVPELYPHMMRHSWAHYMKQGGESEENLMRLAGWRSHQMVARYAASVADERARESSKGRALGDHL